jgi:hypothetical protein
VVNSFAGRAAKKCSDVQVNLRIHRVIVDRRLCIARLQKLGFGDDHDAFI